MKWEDLESQINWKAIKVNDEATLEKFKLVLKNFKNYSTVTLETILF